MMTHVRKTPPSLSVWVKPFDQPTKLQPAILGNTYLKIIEFSSVDAVMPNGFNMHYLDLSILWDPHLCVWSARDSLFVLVVMSVK